MAEDMGKEMMAFMNQPWSSLKEARSLKILFAIECRVISGPGESMVEFVFLFDIFGQGVDGVLDKSENYLCTKKVSDCNSAAPFTGTILDFDEYEFVQSELEHGARFIDHDSSLAPLRAKNWHRCARLCIYLPEADIVAQ